MTDSKIVALIPARGGSKGVPGKNIKVIGGKPLLLWTIEAAKNSRHLSQIIVSSDDEEILSLAQSHRVTALRRPDILATDTATSIDVVVHALQHAEAPQALVLLQPTSPLRTAQDIDSATEVFLANPGSTVVAMTKTPVHPQICFTENSQGRIVPVIASSAKPTRRQDFDDVYCINGAIYIATASHLLGGGGFINTMTKAYHMPAARSIDIDSHLDFKIADFLLHNRDMMLEHGGKHGEY